MYLPLDIKKDFLTIRTRQEGDAYAPLGRKEPKKLKDILDGILSTINDEHPLLVRREDTNPCTIIYTSDMGLCGSFNQNIYKNDFIFSCKLTRTCLKSLSFSFNAFGNISIS